MIALGWNYRELSNLWTVNALHEIVQWWDPNIAFYRRQNLDKKGIERAKERTGFIYGLIVLKSGQSGGLAMLCKIDINLKIMGYARNYIDAIIVESPSGFKWRITGFYGHPEAHQRKESWE